MNRNTLVFGATGKTVQPICKELEANNLGYSVFVQGQSSSKIENSPKFVYTGIVLDATDVKIALAKASFSDVIIALGSKDLKGSKIRSIGTKTIIDALRGSEPKPHIHMISALGVGESWSQLQ